MLVSWAYRPTRAHAERCGPPVPFVELHFSDAPWLAALAPAIAHDLRIGLHARGIAACTPDEPREGPAAVRVAVIAEGDDARLSAAGPDGVIVFARTLALGGLPDDARALSIAANIDEALRSHWGSLESERSLDEQGALAAAATPACPAAPACDAPPVAGCPSPPRCDDDAPVVPEPEPAPGFGWLGIGGYARFDGFSTEQLWLGGGAGIRLRPLDHLEIDLDVGGAGAVPQATTPGVVNGEQLSGIVTLSVTPMSFVEPVRVSFAARLTVAGVWLHGSGDGAVGLSGNDAAVVGDLGIGLDVILDRTVELSVGAFIGYALRGVAAFDGERELTGPIGLMGGGQLGFDVWIL